MKKLNIFIGQKFGMLTIICESPIKINKSITWICKCDCGEEISETSSHLVNGYRTTCGKHKSERAISRFTKHGQASERNGRTSEYNTWKAIKNRCYNPKDSHYCNYGGRGIIVCDRWLNSFNNFFEDMGKKPSKYHSIERSNTYGNYEPNNCHWATNDIQSRNRTNNRVFEYMGEKKILKDWAKSLNIHRTTLHRKLKRKTFDEIYKEYA